MPTKAILNPLNINGDALFTTDSTWLSDVHQRTIRVRADGVIAKGDAVAWVPPTATVPPSVEVMDVSDTKPWLFAGVAANAATAAGDVIDVVIEGFVLANFGSGTITAGNEAFVPATTDGVIDPTGDAGIGWQVTPEFGTTGFAVIYIGTTAAGIDDLT